MCIKLSYFSRGASDALLAQHRGFYFEVNSRKSHANTVGGDPKRLPAATIAADRACACCKQIDQPITNPDRDVVPGQEEQRASSGRCDRMKAGWPRDAAAPPACQSAEGGWAARCTGLCPTSGAASSQGCGCRPAGLARHIRLRMRKAPLVLNRTHEISLFPGFKFASRGVSMATLCLRLGHLMTQLGVLHWLKWKVHRFHWFVAWSLDLISLLPTTISLVRLKLHLCFKSIVFMINKHTFQYIFNQLVLIIISALFSYVRNIWVWF